MGEKQNMVQKHKVRGETETAIKRIVRLTNILETNSARCVVKVHAADFQWIQLCNVMPAYLHTVHTETF